MFRSRLCSRTVASTLLASVLAMTVTFTPAAQANSLDELGAGHATSEAKFVSGTGNIVYLAAGTLLPLFEDGKQGKEHALRTADSLLTSTIITEGLKRLTHEQRPDKSDYTSFPSGHATAAFAVATMESHYHPGQSLLWYGGATLIAASRVQLHRHYVHDVVAGAAVGYFTSRFELSRPHGVLLAPFIHGDRHRDVAGLQFSRPF
jgi:hypothetical protein